MTLYINLNEFEFKLDIITLIQAQISFEMKATNLSVLGAQYLEPGPIVWTGQWPPCQLPVASELAFGYTREMQNDTATGESL